MGVIIIITTQVLDVFFGLPCKGLHFTVHRPELFAKPLETTVQKSQEDFYITSCRPVQKQSSFPPTVLKTTSSDQEMTLTEICVRLLVVMVWFLLTMGKKVFFFNRFFFRIYCQGYYYNKWFMVRLEFFRKESSSCLTC